MTPKYIYISCTIVKQRDLLLVTLVTYPPPLPPNPLLPPAVVCRLPGSGYRERPVVREDDSSHR